MGVKLYIKMGRKTSSLNDQRRHGMSKGDVYEDEQVNRGKTTINFLIIVPPNFSFLLRNIGFDGIMRCGVQLRWPNSAWCADTSLGVRNVLQLVLQ